MSVLDLQVGASADDATANFQGGIWTSSTSTTIAQGYQSEPLIIKMGGGYRFLNVTIAPGSTIDTQTLIFTARAADSATTVNTHITGEDTDDAAAFSTTADYQSRRGTVVGGADDSNITSAQVAWDSIVSFVLDTEYTSPEIKTIGQEIINRAGWVSGNDMVYWWDDHAARGTQASNARRRAYAYDGATTKAAKLHIEYTAGGAARRIFITS